MIQGILNGFGQGLGTINATNGKNAQYFEFNSSGTWQKPTWATSVYIEVIGAGAGGGGGSTSAGSGLSLIHI